MLSGFPTCGATVSLVVLTQNRDAGQAANRGKRGSHAKRSVVKKRLPRRAADELFRIRKLYRANMKTLSSAFEDDRELREIEHRLTMFDQSFTLLERRLTLLDRTSLSSSERERVHSNLGRVRQALGENSPRLTQVREELRENTPKIVAMSVGYSLQFLRFVLEIGIDDRDIATEHVQFAKHIGKIFAEYAKVPSSNQFLCEIIDALLDWLRGVRSPNDSHPLLSQLRRNARALRKQLSLAIEAMNRPYEPDPLVNASISLQSALEVVKGARSGTLQEALEDRGAQPTILGIQEAISLLNRGLDLAASSLDRERLRHSYPQAELPDIKSYPGLAAFVFGLECAARRAGGSFTAHRKSGQKGTLIYALNDLRNYLMGTEWGKALAQCLPPPDGHPTAQYERLLHSGRGVREKQRRDE
jgi:hypothetical protein